MWLARVASVAMVSQLAAFTGPLTAAVVRSAVRTANATRVNLAERDHDGVPGCEAAVVEGSPRLRGVVARAGGR